MSEKDGKVKLQSRKKYSRISCTANDKSIRVGVTITTQTTVSADWLPLKCQPIVKAGEALGHRRVIFIRAWTRLDTKLLLFIYLLAHWTDRLLRLLHQVNLGEEIDRPG